MKKITIYLLSPVFMLFLAGCVSNQPTLVNVNLSAAEIKAVETKKPNVNINLGEPNVNDSEPSTPDSSPPSADQETTKEVMAEIPGKLELAVDFASQAPFGNWDEINEEACEEASMITAAKYFSGEPLNEQIMGEEINKLDAWEKNNGYKIDLSAQQVVDVLGDYFGLKAKVVSEVTAGRIKYELALGNLVIAPAAGRDLQNPYFKSPGPIYHMLVVRGYDSDEFITNEVGTKRGDGFKYKYQRLIDAIHDWDPTWSHSEVTDAQMSAGIKRMVVVDK